MHLKKMFVIIPTLLIVIILVACSGKNSDVVVNSAVKVDSESKMDGSVDAQSNLYTEVLATTSATTKIRFIDKEQDEFFDAIKYNHIDNEYSNTKVIKDNIRINIRANEKYLNNWIDELDKTYAYIEDEIDEGFVTDISNQYKAFKRYYENSKGLYQGILIPNNNYDGIIDGTDTIRQFYSLADEVREYTILLKEYIYMYNKDVEFYTEENKVEKKSKTKYKENLNSINVSIVDNPQFLDIINDYYDKRIDFSTEKLNDTGSNEEIVRYRDYWNVQVRKSYDNVADIFNKEDMKILKQQRNSYKEYIKYSVAVQNKILEEVKYVDFEYKNNIDIENLIFEGKANMKYNILLLEYYYLLTNKIQL